MNIVVIGASAAGMKTACRVRRIMPKASVKVIEKGKYISYSACGLPYFLSGDVDSFRELTTTAYDVEKTPEFFRDTKGVEVLTEISADRIDTKSMTVHCTDLKNNKALELKYDRLVLAVGAEPVIPNIPGVDSPGVHTFANPSDAMTLRKALETRQIERVAVVGAGFIGCELAEAFSALWGAEVCLFEQKEQVLPGILDPETARIVELEMKREDIEIHLSSEITGIDTEDDKLSVGTKSGVHEDFDRIIIASGIRPRTDLAKTAGIHIGEIGGIKVDDRMRTNIENIFAAGDCVESVSAVSGRPGIFALGSLANRMGRVAANVIAGQQDYFGPVSGSCCLKVFDMNVASVGLTAKAAEDAGFNVGEAWGVFTDKLHYYPEYNEISVKIVFDKTSGKLLGVQAVGKGDVIQRIDSASLMIKSGMTIDDMRNFEPAYAPPYANALDPLHFLAYSASVIIEEGTTIFNPLLLNEKAPGTVILDVREPVEIKEKPLEIESVEIITIPLTELRNNIVKIPSNKKLTILCQRGSRSAETARILKEYGFTDIQVMGGGLAFFHG